MRLWSLPPPLNLACRSQQFLLLHETVARSMIHVLCRYDDTSAPFMVHDFCNVVVHIDNNYVVPQKEIQLSHQP